MKVLPEHHSCLPSASAGSGRGGQRVLQSLARTEFRLDVAPKHGAHGSAMVLMDSPNHSCSLFLLSSSWLVLVVDGVHHLGWFHCGRF